MAYNPHPAAPAMPPTLAAPPQPSKYHYLTMLSGDNLRNALEQLKDELFMTVNPNIYTNKENSLFVVYDRLGVPFTTALSYSLALMGWHAYDARNSDPIEPAQIPYSPPVPSPTQQVPTPRPKLPRQDKLDDMDTVLLKDYDGNIARLEDVGLFRGLLAMTGDDVDRPGLHETPARVMKAFKQWFGGYSVDVPALMKTFEDGAEGSDQMVIVKDIPIYSKCEHHMADIFGTATIAYIPNGKIVGLSKLSRLADAFARRLQVQERLTNQIADAIVENLAPKGVGVVIKARHMCMESRGICQQGHHTITSALRGELLTNPEVRAEFMGFVNSH